ANKIIALWPNAVNQGIIAGNRMAGGELISNGAYSVNAIDFYGLRICTCGLINAKGEQYSDKIKTEGNAYKRLVFEGSRLVGFVLINSSDNAGIYTNLIANKIDISTLVGDIMDTPSLFMFDKDTRTAKLTGGMEL
ncbi:MAG: NAD(P)/FAD-dependent oxidoreductase, partial [Eubacterium sp.]|nr:NAD(P)/FAD-dependent oxidoreductase [Eubacterium sp.]